MTEGISDTGRKVIENVWKIVRYASLGTGILAGGGLVPGSPSDALNRSPQIRVDTTARLAKSPPEREFILLPWFQYGQTSTERVRKRGLAAMLEAEEAREAFVTERKEYGEALTLAGDSAGKIGEFLKYRRELMESITKDPSVAVKIESELAQVEKSPSDDDHRAQQLLEEIWPGVISIITRYPTDRDLISEYPRRRDSETKDRLFRAMDAIQKFMKLPEEIRRRSLYKLGTPMVDNGGRTITF